MSELIKWLKAIAVCGGGGILIILLFALSLLVQLLYYTLMLGVPIVIAFFVISWLL